MTQTTKTAQHQILNHGAMDSLRKLMKEVRNPHAVATAQAKEAGYEDFSEGGPGDEKRDEIAEALKDGKLLKDLASLIKRLQKR